MMCNFWKLESNSKEITIALKKKNFLLKHEIFKCTWIQNNNTEL